MSGDGATPRLDGSHRQVVVVGGGQAGLSMSYHLGRYEVDHLVLEQNTVGHEWRERRWDSFCLVTPNWQCQLPGFPYAGDDPHGFMDKDEIIEYLEGFAEFVDAPLVEGVKVTALTRGERGGFEVETSAGELTADQVVVATGGYHHPQIPRRAERFPDSIVQLHSSQYRDAESLPDGEVMVIGTGQSGGQVAEDLHLAGRRVHLCVGGAPRTARFYRARDVTDWLADMGHYDLPVDEHPSGERIRLQRNHYVTGRGGGRDIDLRQFALEGMRLYGRLEAVEGATLRFSPDLRENLDHADEVSESIKAGIDKHIEAEAVSAPEEAGYTPVWEPEEEPREIDLERERISTVIWSTGFVRDFGWIDAPAFDGRGEPKHHRGVTDVEGLFFVGLPWMHTWGSGRFSGVARDAEHLAGRIRARIEQRGFALA